MKAWEKNIRRVVPYVPGEQPKLKNLIKLNTNENPYPPAPGVERVLKEMSADRFRLYPDPTAGKLVEALADYYQVGADQVFVGVGSDDVIAMAFMTFFNSEKPILFPDISYSFYSVWANLFRIPYRTQRLDENFRLRREDYYQENGGIIFPNPNAPTSIGEGLDFVEDIVRHNQDCVVIVDEAYVDFGCQSAIELTKRYENLLVVQTFSKSRSMAGMRIGYAIGNPALIGALNDVKYSYNSYTLNLPSIEMGTEAVKDEKYFKETIDRIVNTREAAKERLSRLGFVFPDSKANFLFISHPEYPAEELFLKLREAGIIVRYFKQERIDNYLRVTVGTDQEMERLYEFLEENIKH